jgi:hypothetical protein
MEKVQKNSVNSVQVIKGLICKKIFLPIGLQSHVNRVTCFEFVLFFSRDTFNYSENKKSIPLQNFKILRTKN